MLAILCGMVIQLHRVAQLQRQDGAGAATAYHPVRSMCHPNPIMNGLEADLHSMASIRYIIEFGGARGRQGRVLCGGGDQTLELQVTASAASRVTPDRTCASTAGGVEQGAVCIFSHCIAFTHSWYPSAAETYESVHPCPLTSNQHPWRKVT